MRVIPRFPGSPLPPSPSSLPPLSLPPCDPKGPLNEHRGEDGRRRLRFSFSLLFPPPFGGVERRGSLRKVIARSVLFSPPLFPPLSFSLPFSCRQHDDVVPSRGDDSEIRFPFPFLLFFFSLLQQPKGRDEYSCPIPRRKTGRCEAWGAFPLFSPPLFSFFPPLFFSPFLLSRAQASQRPFRRKMIGPFQDKCQLWKKRATTKMPLSLSLFLSSPRSRRRQGRMQDRLPLERKVDHTELCSLFFSPPFHFPPSKMK